MKDIIATFVGLLVVGLLITSFILGASGSSTAQGQITEAGSTMITNLSAINP